jgi:hypothetical protein
MIRLEVEDRVVVIREMVTAMCTLNEFLYGDIQERCDESLRVMAGGYPSDKTISFRAPKMDEEWYLDIEEDCIVHIDMFVFEDRDSHENYKSMRLPLYLKPEGI